MRRKLLVIVVSVLTASIGSELRAQATQSEPDPLAGMKNDAFSQIRRGRELMSKAVSQNDRDAASGTISRGLREIVTIAALRAGRLRLALSEAELKRIDKQTGAGPNTPGTTSLVERGTTPLLLGLAVENGAVTRTVDGTTITFRARPASLLNFLAVRDFAASGVDRRSDLWAQAFNKLSVSTSFDVSRGTSNNVFTGQGNQISAYSFRYDVYNHRDPRDRRYWVEWGNISSTELSRLADATSNIDQILLGSANAWVSSVQLDLPPDADDAAIRKRVDDLVLEVTEKLIRTGLKRQPGLQEAIDEAEGAWNTFAARRVSFVNTIFRSPTAALEYSVTRQAPVAADNTSGTGQVTNLPDLGTLRLVATAPIGATADLTFNASITNFNNTFRWDRIRDYRAGLQLDAPAFQIPNWGSSSLSLSALYLHLRNAPLGEKVEVNGIDVSGVRGNIWYGQAKIEIPFGSSGIRLPLALTYASRDELLKGEKNRIGANIGLTFDLDKLAAQKK